MTYRNCEIINVCFFTPVSFGVICYAAIDNTKTSRNLLEILLNMVPKNLCLVEFYWLLPVPDGLLRDDDFASRSSTN